MQCSEIRDMLSAYIDRVLDDHETAIIEEHVGSCRACLQELTELQETVTLLRSLGEVSPPEEFRVRLLERLQQEPLPGNSAEVSGHKASFIRWVRSSRKYLAAAAVILGIGISAGVYSLNQMNADSASPRLALSKSDSSESAKSKTAEIQGSPQQDKAIKGQESEIAQPEGGNAGEKDGGFKRKYFSTEEASSPRQEKTVDPRPEEKAVEQKRTASVAKLPEVAGTGTGDTGVKSPEALTGSQAAREIGTLPAEEQELKAARINDNTNQPSLGISAFSGPAAAPPGAGGGDNAPPIRVGAAADSIMNEQETGKGPGLTSPASESSAGETGQAGRKAQLRIAEDSAAGTQSAEEPAVVSAKIEEGAANKPETGQRVIKDGSLTLEVGDYREFSLKLNSLIGQFRGFVESSTEKAGTPASGSFVIRVPAGQFEGFLDRLSALGTVTGKEVTGRDASGQVVDLQARLNSLHKQEQKLLELVDKARSADEVAELKSELDLVRNETESLKGAVKNIDETAAYSTVRLEVRQTAASGEEQAQDTLGKAASNFKDSATWMAKFVGGMVAFLGLILPWLLVLSVLGGAAYYIWQKKRNRDK